MGQLTFLNQPAVINSQGSIVSIKNAKQSGAQAMSWGYKQMQGTMINSREYTNTLRVITSSYLVGPIQIQQALLGVGVIQGQGTYQFPLPEIASSGAPQTYPDGITGPTEVDPGSFIQNFRFEQETDDQKQWLVTITYGPLDVAHEFGSSEAQNGALDPTEMTPRVRFIGEKVQVVKPFDSTNTPKINTAGDPFLDIPGTDSSVQVLEITRNEPLYNETYAQAYRDSCNADTFLGFSPYQVKCRNITAERKYNANWGYFYEVTYQFEFRVVTVVSSGKTTYYGHDTIILNAGLRQLVNGQQQAILASGAPITSPVPLDANGAVLAPNATPVYKFYRDYPTQVFANLNIPQTLFTASQ